MNLWRESKLHALDYPTNVPYMKLGSFIILVKLMSPSFCYSFQQMKQRERADDQELDANWPFQVHSLKHGDRFSNNAKINT